MRSLQEYNVIQTSLKNRDKLKENYNKMVEKIKKHMSDKSHPDNQTPTCQQEISNRIVRSKKDIE